jgi:hypothetical protein
VGYEMTTAGHCGGSKGSRAGPSVTRRRGPINGTEQNCCCGMCGITDEAPNGQTLVKG